MTWVVGGKHLFCARAVSDVQVTLKYQNGEKNIMMLSGKFIKLAQKSLSYLPTL